VEYYYENESDQTIMVYLTELCKRTIADVGVPKDQYIGLGIGLPGIIDLRSNSSILMERMSHGDVRINIAEELEKAIGIHVYIRNDVHLLALVEKYLYLDKSEKNFLYIALRSGVGMAIFKDGKLLEGNMGNAGYIGHTMIDCNGKQCVCGKRGCLEIMVNSDYLIEEYNAIRKTKGLSQNIVECKNWTFLEMFSKLAEKGDDAAAEVVRMAGRSLGYGVANVIKILDFTSVILGGFPKESQDLLLGSVEESIRENIHRYIMTEVKIEKGKLNYNMAALGGCFLAIDNFFMGPKLKLTI
jgi:predicted NBD/HSP70 family sugar kinase